MKTSEVISTKYCDISFAEKVRIFSSDYLKCCVYLAAKSLPPHPFTKKLYSKLVSTSQVLEDFLDFHGAKNNADWYYYRELTAAVRHLSLGAYTQKHILNRLVFYDLPDSTEFREAGQETAQFLNDSLTRLAPVILEEAQRLNIPVPDHTFGPEDFPGITTGEMLTYNIDDESKDVQKEHIVKIASDFLRISGRFDHLGFYEPYDTNGILQVVPSKVNEVEIRRFEMVVHNLQSAFSCPRVLA